MHHTQNITLCIHVLKTILHKVSWNTFCRGQCNLKSHWEFSVKLYGAQGSRSSSSIVCRKLDFTTNRVDALAEAMLYYAGEEGSEKFFFCPGSKILVYPPIYQFYDHFLISNNPFVSYCIFRDTQNYRSFITENLLKIHSLHDSLKNTSNWKTFFKAVTPFCKLLLHVYEGLRDLYNFFQRCALKKIFLLFCPAKWLFFFGFAHIRKQGLYFAVFCLNDA